MRSSNIEKLKRDLDFQRLESALDNTEAVDLMLADIALSIQLSPSQREIATQHYDEMFKWLSRPESELRDLLVRMYPQGSMAIGATISSKSDENEFDLDVVVELAVAPDSDPTKILNLLEGQIRSKKYPDVTRHTRAIKVQYSEMHVDYTPAVLLVGREDRTSNIFHSKPEDPTEPDRHVVANPWGFADWFTSEVAIEAAFSEALAFRAAEQEKIPNVDPRYRTSRRVIGLQLFKRWRNNVYESRTGRMPPSVMLSCLVGHMPRKAKLSLWQELIDQVRNVLAIFRSAQQIGQILDVRNPRCPEDVFTDRWPGNLGTQQHFIDDLVDFERKLEALAAPIPFNRKYQILVSLFGERPSLGAFEKLRESLEKPAREGGLMHREGNGGLLLGASSIAPALITRPAKSAVTAPVNTSFGGEWPRKST